MRDYKYSSILYFIQFFGLFLLFSCAKNQPAAVNYTFEAATNVQVPIERYEEVSFEPFDDLNLGFFRGNVWIKLNIKNPSKESKSCMFVSNDRFNRNYSFYKLHSEKGRLKLINQISDSLVEDHRTFNNPNPNFKIYLAPYEEAMYLITSSSDGRTKDATPNILSLESYYSFARDSTIWDLVLYIMIIILLLVNIYLWSIYKRNIYLYYILYIISTIFVYLGIEGYLLCLRINNLYIDHFVFISVKLWAFSLIMYTSKFLEIEDVAPRYYKFIKTTLLVVLGSILTYQILFFRTSIQYLHYFENLLTFLWLLMIISIIILSAKKRWLQLKYYLIPLAFFIGFTVFGIVNVHLQLFAGNSFTYVKIGAVFEFIGFTYFMTTLIKKNLERGDQLMDQVNKQREELVEKSKKLEELNLLLKEKTNIEKTDLLNIFALLENSLSSEEEWEKFKEKFQHLNPNFLNELLLKHPDLSKSEIRLLTLVRIGYSQKEIASFLSIAPDSVKKARTRVRKKMNLPEEIQLNEYLLNL